MLGYTVENTYIAITQNAFTDMASLQAIPISDPALQASQNDADLVPPSLHRFSFDLNTGELVLTFSENVTFSTLTIPGITIQNDRFESSENFTLGQNTTARDIFPTNGNEIELTLSPDELNELKTLTMLATSTDSTFISLEANIINDIAENDALPETGQMVAEYIPDATRPLLISFDLDFFNRELTLFFSETVNASSVNPIGIAFTNNGTTTYRLTGGMVLSDDGPMITFSITTTDKNAIKALPDLATNPDNTFISLRTTAISDNAGNVVRRIRFTNPLQVSSFMGDSDRPSLRSFELDVNEGLLVFYFNETVNVSTLFVERFTLQDNVTLERTNHTLTDSTVQRVNSANVTVTLSTFDLNEIKRKQFCTSVEDCYLSFEDDSVRDMVNQSIDGIPDGQAIQVNQLEGDRTRPKIAEFTQIDLADGFITISFTETVNASSLDLTVVTLMDLFDSHITNYTLSGGSVRSTDSSVVRFDLNLDDIRSIQADNYLCTHRGNCYIKFTERFVSDLAGNLIEPVVDEYPGFIVRNFGVDILQPQLLNFSIDMDSGFLRLTFNEPIETSSLDPTGITVRAESNTTDPVLFYRLTGGQSDSPDSDVITVTLNVFDFNNLKASLFAKDINSTYITIETRTITDNAFSPNNVIEVTADDALNVNMYIEDDTPATLQMYTLDMDNDLLILTFNEPVDTFTINCSEITLHNTSSAIRTDLTLSGCNFTLDANLAGMLVITIELAGEDVTVLKVNQEFAVSQDTVYLSFLNTTFSDTAGNPVVPANFFPVTTFLPDQTRPTLISFAYDQNIGQLMLTFSDVVSPDTFDARAITIQHARDREMGRFFTPSSNSTTLSPSGYVITVDLFHLDLLRLKSNTGVARSINDTFISIAAFLIEDTSQINIVPITDGRAIPADLFIPDEDPPILNNYTLDMNLGEIVLTFSDTVNLTTFDPSDFLIQEALNSTADNSSNVLGLMEGIASLSTDGLKITFQINIVDLNQLKQNTNLTTSVNNTFLVVNEPSLLDLAGNKHQRSIGF